MVEHPNLPPNQQKNNSNMSNEEEIEEFDLSDLDLDDNSYPESEGNNRNNFTADVISITFQSSNQSTIN